MMRLYAAEDRRIRAHLGGALALLRSADTSRLGRVQRRNRARHISELDAYMRAGRYPRNTAAGGSMLPALVDPFGTRCALAHLLERSGGEELVQRLRRAENHAFVRDLARDEPLLAWLEEAGLSLAEAARIQPSYRPPASPFLCACNDLGRAPVLVGRVATRDEIAATCEVLVDEVIASPPASPSAAGEGLPVIASTVAVADCTSAAAGAQVLVTMSRGTGGLEARPVTTSGHVVFQACYFGGAPDSSRPPPSEAFTLAQLRAAQPLDAAGCLESLGAPPELIPKPRLPFRLPRRAAADRPDAHAGSTASSESNAVAPTPGYAVVFGGMIVAGAALTVVWVRLRRR
jgi:hypothetical protein